LPRPSPPALTPLCSVFAVFFYFFGTDCFSFSIDGVDFSFHELLWLSVHTFSSVGYGSVAPICAGAQVLVLL
jgi:hypothetical protein